MTTRNHAALSDIRGRIRLSFYLFVAVMTIGTVGFRFISGQEYSMVDCFYMTAITISTVGYGEVIDLSQSPAGRLFAVFLILAGMGVIVYFVSNVTAFLIEGNLNEIFRRKKMQKFIAGLKGHYIVCGAGSIGAHIVQELHSTMRPAVVIDPDPERTAYIQEEYPDTGVITGDATEDEVLLEAGMEKAAGLIAATDNDKDNLVVTITAKQIRPELRVVARCSNMKHMERLRRAGADSVVSSNYIGGLRMASEMVRPDVVTFLDMMLRDKDRSLRIEEMRITEGSSLVGRTALEVKRHVLLLAVTRADGAYEFNPPDGYLLDTGMTLIFMGSPGDRKRLEGLAS